MFLIERSAAHPRSGPPTAGMSAPATTPFGMAAGGAFELFPHRLFPGSGDLVQASMAAPFSAGRTWSEQRGAGQPVPARAATAEGPPKLRRTA